MILFSSLGCSTDDENVVHSNSIKTVDLSISLLDDREHVASIMENVEVVCEDETMIIYNMNDYRKIIACEFQDDKLDAYMIYVYKDMVSWEISKSLFSGFEVQGETSGEFGAYVSREKNMYGEIKSITKDGVDYYCIGISLIR